MFVGKRIVRVTTRHGKNSEMFSTQENCRKCEEILVNSPMLGSSHRVLNRDISDSAIAHNETKTTLILSLVNIA